MRDFPPVFFTVMIGFWHRAGVSDQEMAAGHSSVQEEVGCVD